MRAEIDFAAVPLLTDLASYVAAGITPGGAHRNWDSYGAQVRVESDHARLILCDPQTSGGILAAVAPEAVPAVAALLREQGLERHATPIGRLHETAAGESRITVRL